MNSRINFLKQRIMNAPEGLCMERALSYTRSYQRHEAMPIIIRRSLALKEYLETMTIEIAPGELVIGNYASRPGARSIYPEYSFHDTATNDNNFQELSIEEQLPADVVAFWRGRQIQDRVDALFTGELESVREHKIAGNPYGRFEGHGHLIVDYQTAIRRGFKAIAEEARSKQVHAYVEDPDGYYFYRSQEIVAEALVLWAERFASFANELSNKESDPARAQELKDIARICTKVPRYGAESFQEACQAFWFIHLALHIEQNGFSISCARFDQYMNPYYQHDLAKGVITESKALEMLECMFVKFMEIAIGGVCCSLTPTMTLGGSDGKGNDLANAVTSLCLKAAEETKMVQPQFTVRWHENIPSALLDQVFDVIVAGGAPPAFINERAIIAGFVSHGVAEDDAREFAIIGCNEIGIPGKMIGGGLPRGVALVKALELALDGGVSRYSGKTIGVKTKKLGEFASFDELLAAYKAQVEYFTRFVVAGANEMDIIHRDLGPLPFADSMWHGAMEKGRDLYVESDYFFFGLGCTDFVNAVDSLYVLKKVVFESNTVSQEELAKAIKNNFEGLQQVRKQLLGADKFGNDLETVDALIPLVEKISYDAIKPYRSARKQTHFIMECIPRTAHAAEGAVTQATVDGRIAGCSLAPGMCAEPGKDIQGPTALLNSISKLNIQQWCGGVISNMRLQSSMLTEPDRREKVKRLLAGYFSRNGQHLQINCVTQEILLEAQKHPGDYQDLIVRVGGYCDYFTCMSRPLQDEIIQRTAQG